MNDINGRDALWRRYDGDDWAAYDALPAPVRRRLQLHCYDAWPVNALMLWRSFRRKRGSSARALRALLHYLDRCEALELDAFAEAHRAAHGLELPHVAARVSPLRAVP